MLTFSRFLVALALLICLFAVCWSFKFTPGPELSNAPSDQPPAESPQGSEQGNPVSAPQKIPGSQSDSASPAWVDASTPNWQMPSPATVGQDSPTRIAQSGENATVFARSSLLDEQFGPDVERWALAPAANDAENSIANLNFSNIPRVDTMPEVAAKPEAQNMNRLPQESMPAAEGSAVSLPPIAPPVSPNPAAADLLTAPALQSTADIPRALADSNSSFPSNKLPANPLPADEPTTDATPVETRLASVRLVPVSKNQVTTVQPIGFTIHEVQPGDNLPALAETYLQDAGRYLEIVRLNPEITDLSQILPGTRLRVPVY